MEKWSSFSYREGDSFLRSELKEPETFNAIEQRTGFTFDSQFKYDSTTKYDSIFTYDAGESGAINPVKKGKAKSSRSAEYQCDDWLQSTNTPEGNGSSGLTRGILCFLSGLFLIFFFPFIIWCLFKKVHSNEVYLVRRLGKQKKLRNTGYIILLPFVDKGTRINLEEMPLTIAPLSSPTRDSEHVEIEELKVIYQVEDPIKAACQTGDVHETLRSLVANTALSEIKRLTYKEIEKDPSLISSAVMYASSVSSRNMGIRVLRANVTSVRRLDEKEISAPASSTLPSNIASLSLVDPLIADSSYSRKSIDPVTSLFDRLESYHFNSLSTTPSAVSNTSTLPLSYQYLKHGKWKKVLHCCLQKVDGLLKDAETGASICNALNGFLYCFHVYEGDSLERAECDIRFFLDTNSGKCGEGWSDEGHKNTIIIIMPITELLDVMRGEGSPISSVVAGKIKVRGDLSVAAKLKVFKKHLKHIISVDECVSSSRII